jgi:O-antigen/teichoic acid export membrane protein
MGVKARLEGGIPSTWKRLRNSSFTRGLAILTSASLLQTLITFGSAPVIARLFSPEQFGIAGLIVALAVVPTVLSTGEYFAAIGIARTRAGAVNVVALSFALTAGGAILIMPLALYLGAHATLLPASLQAVAPYLWAIPALMLATNLVSIARLWEIRHASYGPQVTNRLMETGGMAITQIGLGLLGTGALGLIIGRCVGFGAAGLHGLKLMLTRIGRPGLRSITRRRLAASSRRHWRFPAYQLPGAVLNGLTPQLTPLLLGVLYTLEAVGFFWFASRLLSRPAFLLGNNLGRVFYQHAADRRKAGQPVFGIFWRSTAVLAAFGLVPFGLVIAFGPMLFAWIFGAQWEVAGHYAQWIAAAYFVFLISFPAKNATALFALQKAFAVTESCRAVAAAAAVILVAQAGGEALTAVAVGALVQGLISLTFVAFVGVRLYRLDRDASPVVAPDS